MIRIYLILAGGGAFLSFSAAAALISKSDTII